VEEIRLHTERYTVPAATAEAINRALADGRRVVAVGTTATRTLEHIAAQSADGPLHIEPHSGSTSIFLAPGHSFRLVGGLLTNFHLPKSTLLMLVAAFAGDTATTGAPQPALSLPKGLASQMWVGLPQIGPSRGLRTTLAAYDHAIRHGYRFYSYGDCMLLL
jgi:S-adenosylmethionine:tRNA ribosyltransferase-isomerase